MTALLYGSLMHEVVVQGEGNGWKQGLATIAPGAVLERAEGPKQVTPKRPNTSMTKNVNLTAGRRCSV